MNGKGFVEAIAAARWSRAMALTNVASKFASYDKMNFFFITPMCLPFALFNGSAGVRLNLFHSLAQMYINISSRGQPDLSEANDQFQFIIK